MGLTGIQIYKLLPKTNCKECGEPTCLAFAMKLAAGKAELAKCPYVSDEAKEQLSEASAPPIRGITLGTGENAFKIGEEVVLYRHEKTFVNQPGYGILITDTMDDTEVEAKIKRLNEMFFERVGLTLTADFAALKNESGDPSKFESLTQKVIGLTQKALVLISENVDALSAAGKVAKDRRPLLYAATKENADQVGALAKELGVPVAAKANGLDELIELSEKLTSIGLKDIVLDPGNRKLKDLYADLHFHRRAALKDKFKPLGFPFITFPNEMTDDPMKEALYAAIFVAKYAGLIVLSDLDAHRMLPLTVQRLNIYTDPQRPMIMEQGIYEINKPDKSSPVLLTTNFALTYFIVSAEIEASRVPSWLLVMDTEGLSVLTAWSAGKFVADAIAPFVKKSGIEEKVDHRNIIIPGYVAQISGELEEELGGDWKVVLGTREASDIPAFLRTYASKG